MKLLFILFNFLLIISVHTNAIAQDSIEFVLQPILREIQPTIPIADSLNAIPGIVFHRHWPITKKEKRDILRNLRRQKSSIPFKKVISLDGPLYPPVRYFRLMGCQILRS